MIVLKFSVLMSVYIKENPKYMKQSLDSIINQTYKPSEIVIVKDGLLTKELNDLIDEYQKKYTNLFKIITLEENVGLGKSLNIGVLNCTYDIIARMDTDDICRNDRFEKQIKVLKNNKHIDIVGSNIVEFIGEEVSNIKGVRSVPQNYNEIMKYAKKRNPFNHMTVMYRKIAVLDSGNYQESLFSEDYHLWVRMLIKGHKGININENLVFVRCNEDTYKRRGGMKYIKSEINLQRQFLKWGYINYFEFLFNIVSRIFVRILPNSIRSTIYNLLLRSKGI